jgi:CRISPR-associated protein Cas1
MLKGRLGLEGAHIPQADRHGLMWLGRGKLYVEDGCLTFVTAGYDKLKPGVYEIPYQTVSHILIGPGTTISHDALRLLARHQTGLLAVGEDGVRFYASMPFGPDNARLARRQAHLWADAERRLDIAVKMYALRMGVELPHRDLNALTAQRYGVPWSGRRYDRANPEGDDIINQAINHVATAVQAAAMTAVVLTATIPQLGFIHESSGSAFALDIADLYRASLTIPVSFEVVQLAQKRPGDKLERIARRLAGERMTQEKLIPSMIDNIKALLGGGDDDDRRDP